MTYYPLSGYKIDGNDLWGTYRVTVKKITGLHGFLSRKGDISQSWLDSDGEEPFTDWNDIYFEGNDVIMFCYLRASSWTTFQSMITSFKNKLESTGLKTLTVPYTSTTFSLMYVKGSDIEMLTPKQNVNQYVGEFWIQFRQTTPVRS